MGIVLYTFHAYGSWLADHRDGYVQHDEDFVKLPDERLGNWQRNAMKGEAVLFEEEHQRAIALSIHDSTLHQGKLLHAYVVHENHVHALIDQIDEQGIEKYGQSLKRRMSMGLREALGEPEVRWWAKRFHWKWVDDEEHLWELKSNYLPRHREQGAMVWIKDE